MGTDRAMTTYPDDVVEKALLAFHNGVMFGSYTQELQDAMRRALASAEAAMWRPIETAPKDGTQLLLVSEDGVQVVGYWGKHNHVPLYGWLRPVELYGEEVDGLDPTHWMPLPEKP